jgi:putative ATPase
MGEMGYGKDYKYAHDYPEHFAAMENLPQRLQGRRYYEPSEQGYEREVAQRIQEWWGERRGKVGADG